MIKNDRHMLDSAESMLNQSDRVKELCQSLFANLKIQYYEYQHVDLNGEGLLLVSDDRIYRDFLDHSLVGYEALDANFNTYKKLGYYAHDLMEIKRPDLQTYITVLEEYGHGHIFTMNDIVYDNSFPMIVSHTFATRITDTKAFNQYYLENIRALQSFSKYFHGQMDSLNNNIKQFKTTRSIESKSRVIKKCKKFIQLDDFDFNRNRNTEDSDFKFDTLSKRQREIIHWYVKGKSAAETAEVLNLSKRTIENHFYRLQKKYGCSSKAQILIKLLKNDMLNL